ncbi:MAG: hypothetical protein OXG38_02160 [Chloroflexi bacterium]|nr:hypothetical protein [Chloroflexota bacterium]
MTRIPGYLRPVSIPDVAARPNVHVEVRIEGAPRVFDVHFLIDTGADDTILHPRDVPPRIASLLASSFDDHPEGRQIGGVGGGGYIIPVTARLSFRTDTGAGRIWHDARVWVARPTDANRRLPSLLGRDLLQHFRLTVDYEADPPVLLERP